MAAGKAVDTAGAALHNVPAGTTVFETVLTLKGPADAALCRIDRYVRRK